MKAYLARWVCTDVASNLRRMGEEAADAVEEGADLVVFPELFLQGYARVLDCRTARAQFAEISSFYPETTFVFGSISCEGKNRTEVWRQGRVLGHYDKVHLFPPNGELERWTPGDRYVAVRAGDWTLGLLNCNDLRFPDQARALRMATRCDALIVVAWWPFRREHLFRLLLQARAYENGVFCLGCCIAASEDEQERFAGAGNFVFDPLGEPVLTRDDHSYHLERAVFSQVMVDPLLSHVPIRKVEVFGPQVGGLEPGRLN